MGRLELIHLKSTYYSTEYNHESVLDGSSPGHSILKEYLAYSYPLTVASDRVNVHNFESVELIAVFPQPRIPQHFLHDLRF